MSSIGPEKKSNEETAATVSGTVLDAFFSELDKTDSLKEFAPNLRKLVMDDGVMAEAAIRKVLFPDEP